MIPASLGVQVVHLLVYSITTCLTDGVSRVVSPVMISKVGPFQLLRTARWWRAEGSSAHAVDPATCAGSEGGLAAASVYLSSAPADSAAGGEKGGIATAPADADAEPPSRMQSVGDDVEVPQEEEDGQAAKTGVEGGKGHPEGLQDGDQRAPTAAIAAEAGDAVAGPTAAKGLVEGKAVAAVGLVVARSAEEEGDCVLVGLKIVGPN